MNVTLDMAKTLFFDPKKIEDPAKRAWQRRLAKTGSLVRQIAKNSMPVASGPDDHSQPGHPPKVHNAPNRAARKAAGLKLKKRFKDFVFFYNDRAKDEVVIGGILLPRADRTIVPGVLEYSGEVEHRAIDKYVNGVKVKGPAVTKVQEARPHMNPAMEKFKEEYLDDMIKDCIHNI